jgi:hypothetical protein
VRCEKLEQPLVEDRQDVLFFDVDVVRVLYVVGQRVVLGVPAAVVRFAVVLLSLHLASAQAAPHAALEDVEVLGARAFAGGAVMPVGGADLLGGLEVCDGHQRLVDNLVRPDPAALLVPAQLGLITLGDVLDVEEDFVFALLVPHLASGVAGVLQDRLDRALAPAFAGAVAVASRVGLRRREDLVAGESFGDGVEPASAQVLGEDPLYDGSVIRVGF